MKNASLLMALLTWVSFATYAQPLKHRKRCKHTNSTAIEHKGRYRDADIVSFEPL